MLSTKSGKSQEESHEALVARKLENSLARIDMQELDNLYEMVLHQGERTLINIVLQQTRDNQVRTAEILGISRTTPRKKIKMLEIDVKRGD